MKAKYEIPYQYKKENRTRLSEAIPLKSPLSMQIETASACNFKCKFCIHGNQELIKDKRFKLGVMSFELFKKIVNSMHEFPQKLNYVSLHARGEPLLNPNIVEMVKYIKQENVAKEVSFNTNGVLLTDNISLGLINAGLDCIRFSIEGINSEAYMRNSGVDIDFQKLVNNIRFFFERKKNCYTYIKIINCDLSEVEKEKFYGIFGDICDNICIENITDTWKDAGLNNEKYMQLSRFNENFVKGKVCPRLFFACQVRFDGTVTTCDSDWNELYPLGNVYNETLLQIWTGQKFNELRKKHLTNNINDMKMCINCSNLLMSESDYIDGCADTLLKYFI